MKNKHYQIVIAGGGTAGIWAAARLKRQDSSLRIAIVEPSETHYYQPAFTLVGAGAYAMADTHKPTASLIPPDVDWIKDKVTQFYPEKNELETEDNGKISYDSLIVALGMVYDFSLIEGLEEAFEKGVVCSNYIDPEFVWESIQNFKGGNAVFTQANTPIKCGGAPQKIMYLMAHHLQRKKELDKAKITFAAPTPNIFPVTEIAKTLNQVIERYGIETEFFHAPVRVDADKKTIYFKNINPKIPKNKAEKEIALSFDFLHLAPPQRAPEVLRNSKLANGEGWTDCDPHSLQHKTYKNVFGLGDATGIPNLKTGSAIRKQLPVVRDNILDYLSGKEISNFSYDGYSGCPMVTAYGKMVLGEFDYDFNFTPDPELKKMLVFDSSKEHWRLWLLKKYGLPYMYWNKMMRGQI